MVAQVQTEALAATIDAVRDNLRQTAEPVVTFAADTELLEEYRTRVKIRDFDLIVDEPPLIGGGDAGPTPVELVLAALGTGTGAPRPGRRRSSWWGPRGAPARRSCTRRTPACSASRWTESKCAPR